MHLENSEQTPVSGEEAPTTSTEAVLSAQCQVPKLPEDCTASSNGAEFAMKVLMEYTEETVNGGDASSHGSNNKYSTDEADSYEHCNGHSGCLEQSSDESSDETLDKCETLRLSQEFEECAEHRECFKPCKSAEHCANHRLASECSSCPEHCAGHLHSCQHGEATDEQLESHDEQKSRAGYEPREMSDFTPECTHNLQLPTQDELSSLPYRSVDSEPSTDDCEICATAGLTANISDSVDLSDCATECCEYEESQSESEFINDGNDTYQSEGAWTSDEESCGLTNGHRQTLTEDNFEECADSSNSVVCPETCEDYEYETTAPSEQYDSTDCTEYFSEEDGSSDCSSIESKSFKTCADGSAPSAPASDSSGESEKGTHEDSSDEQTQWESFEDDDDIQQNNMNKNDGPKRDHFVIEDFFDLFDRTDHYGSAFAQRRQYVSCFDGGDIHEHLYVEEARPQAQKHSTTHVQDFIETNIDGQESDACEDECDSSARESQHQPKEWEEESQEPNDDNEYERETSATSTDNAHAYLSAADEERMCAPYADDISVEGDAYEENISGGDQDTTEEQPDGLFFSVCSDTETHWSLGDKESEVCDSGVEEYFARQMSSSQTPTARGVDGFKEEGRSHGHRIDDEGDGVERDATETVCRREPTAQTHESEDDCRSNEGDARIPADIIHSVVSEVEGIDGHTEDSEDNSDDDSIESCDCEYCSPSVEQGAVNPLLPQMKSIDEGKICVVIDLDETLVHSSFKPLDNADFIIPVEMEGTVYQVYVLKRPHVDEFLQRMGEMFECVLFTASLSKYADPVSDLLDKCGAFRSRLFRESCVFHKGNYVKDLSRLGRDVNKVIIIDNSPASYIFHPDNAVPVASWFDDASDSELLHLLPFFERLSKVDDIYDMLKQQRTSS